MYYGPEVASRSTSLIESAHSWSEKHITVVDSFRSFGLRDLGQVQLHSGVGTPWSPSLAHGTLFYVLGATRFQVAMNRLRYHRRQLECTDSLNRYLIMDGT